MDPIRLITEWFRQKYYKDARAGAHDPSSVALWCQKNFDGEKVMKHYMRIERRLGRMGMMLRGKFMFEEKAIRPVRHPWWWI